MASLQKRTRKGKDAFLVQYLLDGKRKTLFLGSKYTFQAAKEICSMVEKIVCAISTGSLLDKRTSFWLDGIDDDLCQRMANCGLVEHNGDLTVGELFEKYNLIHYGQGCKLSKNSVESYLRFQNMFFSVVDKEIYVSEIDYEKADVFVASFLRSRSNASFCNAFGVAKAVFSWAFDREIIAKNPFSKVKIKARKNKEREYIIDQREYEALIDSCKTQKDRALLAVYRYGGVRREEGAILRWSDVNFAEGKITIRSPKTKSKGRAFRVIPLFPKLREELEAYWETIPEGAPDSVFGISGAYVYEKIGKLIKESGVSKWERIVQNFRVTRSNEIFREYGALAEAAWIGHSTKTAVDHYLHVLDDEFSKANGGCNLKETIDIQSTNLKGCNSFTSCKNVCNDIEKEAKTNLIKVKEEVF